MEKMSAPFNQQNDSEIQAQLNHLKKRALPFQIASIVSIVCIVLFFLSFFINGATFLIYGNSVFIIVLLLFITAAISTFFYSKRNNELKKFISEEVTQNLLKEVFDVDDYNYQSYIAENRISNLDLLRSWDRCEGNNYLRGRYKGHPVELCYMKLEEVTTSTDSDGHTTENVSTVFEGPIVFLSHGRKLKSPLRLRERQLLLNRGGSNVETENLAFNKKFQIRCDDGHTAFLILTPHFMEFITSMDERVKGTTYMYFGSDLLVLALHNNRRLFQVSSRDAKDINVLRAKQLQDISYLSDILDEIMRNEYLFKS